MRADIHEAIGILLDEIGAREEFADGERIAEAWCLVTEWWEAIEDDDVMPEHPTIM